MSNATKKREMDQMRKQYIKEKRYNDVEMWECKWWNLYKSKTCVKEDLRESFSHKRPLWEEKLLEQIRSGNLFGHVHCDIEVPEQLKKKFANYPPIFKNKNVGRHDIGLPIKDYAEKEGLLCQPRKLLILSFVLENGTLITPLLLFYLALGLVCKKIYRFVEYIPNNCFNKFVQSAVNTRRERDENPNSSVVAKILKLLANSSYGYQSMDRSSHTVTKYLSDEKTRGAINTKLFKRLHQINDQLYEVELVKAEVVHRKPIIAGVLILQYAKLRMLELYYNFFERFCDVSIFEEIEMDTDTLYLALSEKELYDCIRVESKVEWELLGTKNCKVDFTANATTNFFPRTCCRKHKKHDKREPGFSKRSFVVRKCCVYAVKPIVVMTPLPTNTNSAAKV